MNIANRFDYLFYNMSCIIAFLNICPNPAAAAMFVRKLK